MMFVKCFLTTALCFLFAAVAMAKPNSHLNAKDITIWPSADAKSFGCFLEKEFHSKDQKFNCSLKTYKNNGDPCKNVEEYTEGPVFPVGKAALVDKRFKAIDLTWEHGELQSLAVTLDGKFKEAALRADFKLPKSASIQDCSTKDTCIVLTGFDHMGAGDVECGEP